MDDSHEDHFLVVLRVICFTLVEISPEKYFQRGCDTYLKTMDLRISG